MQSGLKAGPTGRFMSVSPRFIFATCQVGAEPALKQEQARIWPDFKFAYSRPGFLTFKVPPGAEIPDSLDLKNTFARAHGLSLGKATAASLEDRAREVWQLLGELPIEQLHVWPRDPLEPGAHDFEPGLTDEAAEIGRQILAAAPADLPRGKLGTLALNAIAAPGQLVADVVLIDADQWWVGIHRAHSLPSSWPGGFCPDPLPDDAVSRVYLKMLESLQWSGFEIGKGDQVAEIGCSPGGASQVLLNRGAKVIGVDPAEMHPLVLGHPRFRHVRRRSKEVKRSEFVGVNWITCDINLPPNYTLDTIEAIITHPGVKLRGMLLTLKMIDWSLAARIPEYIQRVRNMGFTRVQVRQLHHNRREICLAASEFRAAARSAAGRKSEKPRKVKVPNTAGRQSPPPAKDARPRRPSRTKPRRSPGPPSTP
jgi:23S rRNA (cytidine2498-2'-O)-methyltransferase